jgi:hypothetical protein
VRVAARVRHQGRRAQYRIQSQSGHRGDRLLGNFGRALLKAVIDSDTAGPQARVIGFESDGGCKRERICATRTCD